ncbi:phosphotransferase [Nocardioides sp.]|uniref:phosphotransferase n=1 Tax=Nocardioides sp. TaxID=35761 RepID=UPI002B7A8802|nr:phosphotransferase [Nocardioides sp.]HXH78670.1 phosphotransferase [Nocardioides sp.]
MAADGLQVQDEELEALLDQIPALSGRPRSITELSGGLTNRNLKVTTPAGSFVARCSALNADALDIDRDVEHHNTCAAERAGVGAPVVDYRPDLGVLVIGFLEGVTLSRESFANTGVVERVAASCRQLHDGPRFEGTFDMFERQQAYLRTVQTNGFRLPPGYLDHAEVLSPIRQALTVRDEGTVPCNNDLLAENFVDDGSKIWLIDYEYSGNNDAAFELGNIWAECRLSLDQLEALVTAYYGRPRPSKVARARLQGIVGQYGWTLWGAIQDAVSPVDFDFWQWALERYDLATSQMRGPDLESLLEDVQRAD